MVVPSFDNFLQRSTGAWRGAGYTWSPTEPSTGLAMPLGVVEGFITPPAESSCEVSEVMRSCGGAVQGVREERQQPIKGDVTLNRQVDGFTYFSDGSWAEAPASLSEGAGADFGAVGLQLCIAHGDGSRRRLLLCLVEDELVACDVHIEGRVDEGADAADAAPCVPASAQTLLDGKLQVLVVVNAWEGGATSTELEGSPPAEDTPWSNARTQWASESSRVAGGAPLLPKAATFLPGGCYVTVVRASDGALQVEAGSCAAAWSKSASCQRQRWPRSSRAGLPRLEAPSHPHTGALWAPEPSVRLGGRSAAMEPLRAAAQDADSTGFAPLGAAEAAEVKAVRHSWTPEGALVGVVLREVEVDDD